MYPNKIKAGALRNLFAVLTTWRWPLQRNSSRPRLIPASLLFLTLSGTALPYPALPQFTDNNSNTLPSVGSSSSVPRSNVIGGARWPFFSGSTVQLRMLTTKGLNYCSGTALSNVWILTAKHCLQDPGNDAWLTAASVEATVNQIALADPNLPQLPVAEIELNDTADAALVRLASPALVFTSHYGTGITPSYVGPVPNYMPGVLAGWGAETVKAPGEDPPPRPPSPYLKFSLVLKTSRYDIGIPSTFNPATLDPWNWLYGQPTGGDSGAGIHVLGLVCGVYKGGPDPYGIYADSRNLLVTSTDSIAAWIQQITQIPPDPNRTCDLPNEMLRTRVRLRVEALGASITQGLKSSDGAGYRNSFRAALGGIGGYQGLSHPTMPGIPSERPESDLIRSVERYFTDGTVDMVGRKNNGAYPDRENEGYPGFRIDQVAKTAECSIPLYRPNLVSLLVGTNDVQQNYDLPNASVRVEALVRQVLRDSPKATVLVSAIPPNTDTSKPWLQDRTAAYNATIPNAVADLVAEGLHVVYVPSSVTADQVGPDHIHPTDAGYDQIAVDFLGGAYDAADRGWLTDPDPMGEAPPGCRGPNSFGGDPYTAPYTKDPNWKDTGDWLPGVLAPGESYRFADMNGDGRADLISIHPDQSWEITYNHGPAGDGWSDWSDTSETFPARAPGLRGYNLRLADMDGDGRPDCIGVDPFGGLDVRVWNDSHPCAKDLPHMDVHTTGDIPGSSYINIVDVNGDGLPDYVITSHVQQGLGGGQSRIWLRKTFDDTTERAKEANAAALAAEQDPANVEDPGAAGQAAYQHAYANYSPWKPPFQVDAMPSCVGGTRPDAWRWGDIYGGGNARPVQFCSRIYIFNFPSLAAAPGVTFTPSPTGIAINDFLYRLPDDQFQFADMDGDGKADLIRVNSATGLRVWLNHVSATNASPSSEDHDAPQ